MSPSAPVAVQVREYIDPTIGVATLDVTLTVIVGSGDEKDYIHAMHITLNHLPSTETVIIAESIALPSVALHVYVPA